MSKLEKQYGDPTPDEYAEPVPEPAQVATEQPSHTRSQTTINKTASEGETKATKKALKKTNKVKWMERTEKNKNHLKSKPSVSRPAPLPGHPDFRPPAYLSNQIEVQINGRMVKFDPIFLRDSCTCARCVDLSTSQKLFSTTDISGSIRVKDSWVEGNLLNLTWEGDLEGFGPDHVTSLGLHFLDRAPRRRPVSHYRYGKHIWTADYFEQSQTTFDYNDYMSHDESLLQVLQQLHKYGLVFLSNVPETEASISEIATRIGPLKNTFYGNTWDVRSVANAKNVAYTSQDLGFHMDLLYMHQPPRLQFLHCLKASTEGGTSLFSDSYLAAKTLWKTDNTSFNNLVEQDVNFHYDNDSQHYHQSRRVFQVVNNAHLDPLRTNIIPSLEAVNWSPPFQGTFHNNKGEIALMSQIRRWHKAAQKFRDLVESKRAVYRRQMPPGECVLFDNRRVLHARTAFSGGERWLRGAYLDSDPFLSKLRVLERQYGGNMSTLPSQRDEELD